MARGRRAKKRRTSFAPRLVIMAKRPVMGRVKRRLAQEIGDVAAIRFYRTCLSQTVRRLSRDPRWRTVLAVAPDVGIGTPCWADPVEYVPQGTGDLGHRMQRLFDAAPPGPVVIVGADIPAMRARDVAAAFKLLGQADMVFGPAPDGGYWLVGMKRCPRRLQPFLGVPWSSAEALSATLNNLAGAPSAFAPRLSDVDTVEDYGRERTSAERLVSRRTTH
ncbi:MAG: TIGR04282 family arsenosugar biosynthesis glycosyltransferase [Hyphomicrobiales bacterium]